ncbi:cutinase family protein [Mycolicibacterium cosmeticum]|uniref:cutinase family protein n=1 Tax=Mycolicibacterium cosmeticum TaxID=258533 RepID=UPI000D6B394B|nr:cutinase family protein [Mycolicibacterium cosmeticum]TLH74525.1 cutinase family protein [Mycolicibacterium cosmeticum]
MVTISISVRRFAASVLVAASAVGCLAAWSTTGPSATLPVASADPCAPVEVIFARGRNEQPGVGRLGQAFVDALRARVPDKEIGVYGVNYPADTQIAQGANDISNHVQYMAGACPDTRLIVGGYSLGAASAAVALSATGGGFGFKNPLPPGMDPHIAAVVLVGNVTRRMGDSSIAPQYRDRTFEACNPADPICGDGFPRTIADLQRDWSSHLQDAYIGSGMVDQAADFAAGRVR